MAVFIAGMLLAAAPFPLRSAEITGQSFPLVTNLHQLAQVAASGTEAAQRIQLEGNVWWANARDGRFVLQDDSATAELEADLWGQRLAAGERVRLEGVGAVTRRASALRIGEWWPLVNNDGLHSMIEQSATIKLSAGRHPLRIDYFNSRGTGGFEFGYEGPGLTAQPVPPSALFRASVDAHGATQFVNGLEYRYFEGLWRVLPDFNVLKPLKTGTSTNFDLSVMARVERTGLQWRGFLAVPRDGSYTFRLKSKDGSRLFLGGPALRVTQLGPAERPTPRRVFVGEALREDENLWAQLDGTVTHVREKPEGLELELTADGGRVRVEVVEPGNAAVGTWLNRRVRATGFCWAATTSEGLRVPGVSLVQSAADICLLPDGEPAASGDTNVLLRTVDALIRLNSDDLAQKRPVSLEGVVTCVLPEHRSFVIQDATRGVYVSHHAPGTFDAPRVGERLKVEGATSPGFSPIVNASCVTALGPGILPEPVQPTWEQLVNGSLDAQWVELEGVMEKISTRPNGWSSVRLRMRIGTIQLELLVAGMQPEALARLEHSHVRLRGCMFAAWDAATLRVKVGQVRMYDAWLTVDAAPPSDPFDLPVQTVAQLRGYNPLADPLKRVKVSGQIIMVRAGEYMMMSGADGLRFWPAVKSDVELGDLIDVIGYPVLTGGAPVLGEAQARKTGRRPLPEPVLLRAEDLVSQKYDVTRVRVQGLLASVRRVQTNDLVLEVQAGSWRVVARAPGGAEVTRHLPLGSELALTGVFRSQGGNRALGEDVAPVDLLIETPADIQVLRTPSWWTLRRALTALGLLVLVLAGMTLWVTQLRRKVEQRTAELGEQIHERQRAEHQREMEQERARIAQDLHDELGSDITTVSMLAKRAQFTAVSDEQRSRYLEQMGEKAQEMVALLDEIVWAMNPRHDSLASVVSYLSGFAERFLGLANISLRLDLPAVLPERAVESRHRHQLFMVFKEALANVVHHAAATEVSLNIRYEAERLRVAIADNGRGLEEVARTQNMDGIANMRDRIEKLGGRFELESAAGRGTTLRLEVPIKEKP